MWTYNLWLPNCHILCPAQHLVFMSTLIISQLQCFILRKPVTVDMRKMAGLVVIISRKQCMEQHFMRRWNSCGVCLNKSSHKTSEIWSSFMPTHDNINMSVESFTNSQGSIYSKSAAANPRCWIRTFTLRMALPPAAITPLWLGEKPHSITPLMAWLNNRDQLAILRRGNVGVAGLWGG